MHKQDPPCELANESICCVCHSVQRIDSGSSRAFQLRENADTTFIPASRSSMQEEFAYLTLVPDTDMDTSRFKHRFGRLLADPVNSSSKIRRQSRFSVRPIGLDCTSLSLATPFQTRSTESLYGGHDDSDSSITECSNAA